MHSSERSREGLSAKQSPLALFTGFAGGLIASIPMAWVMQLLFERLPWFQKSPLPPEQITTRIARRAGLGKAVDEPRERNVATWLGHLSYGASVGALYPITIGRLPLPWIARGVLFGAVVWTGSYMGWIPALDILPPATEQPSQRNALMIFSHFVWGTIIALVSRPMEGHDENEYYR